jgi:hypothetical protein
MRALRLLLAAVLTGGALLVLAPTAGAASSNAKTCKTLRQLDQDLSSVDIEDENDFDQEAFAEIGDAFHDASRKAKGKLKSALNSIGDVYDDLGDSDNYVEAIQSFGRNGEKWTKAFGIYATQLATSCV